MIIIFMRIIYLIIIYFFIQLISFGNTEDFLFECEQCSESDSYKNYKQIIKGEATISDIEQRQIIDNEIQKELNSVFI